MLYLKLFVCLIVIICFIMYYSRKKEGFYAEPPQETSEGDDIAGIYSRHFTRINVDRNNYRILSTRNLNRIEIVIEFDDDFLRDKIIEYTYNNINLRTNAVFSGKTNLILSIPRISFNGNELIQLIKRPPTICGNDFIFMLPLESSEFNFRRIVEYYMPLITNEFSVPINNIKFYLNTDANQQISIYVIISNTDINILTNMYNRFVNNNVDDNVDDIPSMICPAPPSGTTREPTLVPSIDTTTTNPNESIFTGQLDPVDPIDLNLEFPSDDFRI